MKIITKIHLLFLIVILTVWNNSVFSKECKKETMEMLKLKRKIEFVNSKFIYYRTQNFILRKKMKRTKRNKKKYRENKKKMEMYGKEYSKLSNKWAMKYYKLKYVKKCDMTKLDRTPAYPPEEIRKIHQDIKNNPYNMP